MKCWITSIRKRATSCWKVRCCVQWTTRSLLVWPVKKTARCALKKLNARGCLFSAWITPASGSTTTRCSVASCVSAASGNWLPSCRKSTVRRRKAGWPRASRAKLSITRWRRAIRRCYAIFCWTMPGACSTTANWRCLKSRSLRCRGKACWRTRVWCFSRPGWCKASTVIVKWTPCWPAPNRRWRPKWTPRCTVISTPCAHRWRSTTAIRMKPNVCRPWRWKSCRWLTSTAVLLPPLCMVKCCTARGYSASPLPWCSKQNRWHAATISGTTRCGVWFNKARFCLPRASYRPPGSVRKKASSWFATSIWNSCRCMNSCCASARSCCGRGHVSTRRKPPPAPALKC